MTFHQRRLKPSLRMRERNQLPKREPSADTPPADAKPDDKPD